MKYVYLTNSAKTYITILTAVLFDPYSYHKYFIIMALRTIVSLYAMDEFHFMEHSYYDMKY